MLQLVCLKSNSIRDFLKDRRNCIRNLQTSNHCCLVFALKSEGLCLKLCFCSLFLIMDVVHINACILLIFIQCC